MATSIISASTVVFPLGVSTSALTPLSVFSTLVVFEPVRIVSPRLVRLLLQARPRPLRLRRAGSGPAARRP